MRLVEQIANLTRRGGSEREALAPLAMTGVLLSATCPKARHVEVQVLPTASATPSIGGQDCPCSDATRR